MSKFLPLNLDFWLSTNREDTSLTEGTNFSVVDVSHEKFFFANLTLIDISLSFEMTKQELHVELAKKKLCTSFNNPKALFGLMSHWVKTMMNLFKNTKKLINLNNYLKLGTQELYTNLYFLFK